MKYMIFFLVCSLISISALAQSPHQSYKKKTAGKYTAYKKYVNEKFGFAFQYPNTWSENGQAAEVINLDNIVTNLSVAFIDSKTNARFTVEYYLPPMGRKLYDYDVSQYKSSQGWYAKDKKQMVVAGNNALVANMETTADGKGRVLSKPLKTIIVTFPDKQQTGEMKLQLFVDTDNLDEVKYFDAVIASFEFINAK